MLNLVRVLLSNFAADVGLKNYLANLFAAAFIKRNETDINSITVFIQTNCGLCKHNALSCDYLNPKETINISKEDVFKMNFNLITQGQIQRCPQFTEEVKRHD
jgi:hypothetical protein